MLISKLIQKKQGRQRREPYGKLRALRLNKCGGFSPPHFTRFKRLYHAKQAAKPAKRYFFPLLGVKRVPVYPAFFARNDSSADCVAPNVHRVPVMSR